MASAAAAYEEYEEYEDGEENTFESITKEEQIEGVIYSMSPAPNFVHNIVTSNIEFAIKKVLDKKPCKVFKETLELHYHPNIGNEWKKGDYVMPDVMIACDPSLLHGGGYYGVPKFVAEVASPSTTSRDRKTKFCIYEEMGVSEYWLVNPRGTLEIYYLADGRYTLQSSYMLCDEEDDKDYNVNQEVSLREFPQVKMTLGDIFY